ncbi:hypothetical protein EGI97_00850 [Stutzerimonas xanthomarina]|nr:hypothetical protein EGI97_00850 [Stutzerimonas xanthomarina]
MIRLFYLVSFLPGLVVPLGNGGVPSRYFSFAFFFSALRISRLDLSLVMLICFAAIYPVLAFPVRPFHLLDISYLLSFIYFLFGVTIVRKRLLAFRRFVFVFWFLNVAYAALQNVIINVMGGDSTFALLHQNAHSPDYRITPTVYFPYLYRVTGLFVESAPFVIYLIFTHFAFVLMRFGKGVVLVNLLFIFLSGAKVGIVFLVALAFISAPFFRRFSVISMMLLGAVLIAVFGSSLYEVMQGIEGYGLQSVLIRMNWLSETITHFSNSLPGVLFGYGYVSTHDLIFDEAVEFHRGIDFFSIFVFSNGIIGSCLFLAPVFAWLWLNFDACKEHRNLLVIVVLLAFMTVGSLVNFQYAYLLFIVAYCSARKSSSKAVGYEEKTGRENKIQARAGL